MTRRPHANPSSGFTAIEVLISLTVLAIAILALVSALGTSSALRVQDRALSLAQKTLDERLERYRGMDPSTIISQVQNGPPTGTINGAGNLASTLTGGALGRDPETNALLLPSASLTTEILSENTVRQLLGLPSGSGPDFDGNANEASSIFASYRDVAPVRLTLTWAPSPGQTRTQSAWTIFYSRS